MLTVVLLLLSSAAAQPAADGDAPAALLARAEQHLHDGDVDAALKAALRLSSIHPDSPLNGEVFASLGAYYTEREDLTRALLTYHRSAKWPASERRLESLYMTTWLLHYGGASSDTREYLGLTLRWLADNPGHPDATLLPAVLDEVVIFVRDLEDLDAIEAFYEEHGISDRFPTEYIRLGELYRQWSRDALARECYRRAIDMAPMDPRALQWQRRIINSHWTWETIPGQMVAVEEMVALYGPGSMWASRNDDGGGVEEQLRMTAERLEWRNRQTRANPFYEWAVDVYAVWDEAFPGSAQADAVRDRYALLLKRLRRYDEAFAQYQRVVDSDPHSPRAQDCSVSSIYVAVESLRLEGDSPEWKARRQAAIDRHLTLWPEDESVRKLAETGR